VVVPAMAFCGEIFTSKNEIINPLKALISFDLGEFILIQNW